MKQKLTAAALTASLAAGGATAAGLIPSKAHAATDPYTYSSTTPTTTGTTYKPGTLLSAKTLKAGDILASDVLVYAVGYGDIAVYDHGSRLIIPQVDYITVGSDGSLLQTSLKGSTTSFKLTLIQYSGTKKVTNTTKAGYFSVNTVHVALAHYSTSTLRKYLKFSGLSYKVTTVNKGRTALKYALNKSEKTLSGTFSNKNLKFGKGELTKLKKAKTPYLKTIFEFTNAKKFTYKFYAPVGL